MGHMSKISNTYVKKQNLTMRMSIRFLTRFANAFNKRADNLKTAVALHYVQYDVVDKLNLFMIKYIKFF
jgi:hypothetical protein